MHAGSEWRPLVCWGLGTTIVDLDVHDRWSVLVLLLWHEAAWGNRADSVLRSLADAIDKERLNRSKQSNNR